MTGIEDNRRRAAQFTGEGLRSTVSYPPEAGRDEQDFISGRVSRLDVSMRMNQLAALGVQKNLMPWMPMEAVMTPFMVGMAKNRRKGRKNDDRADNHSEESSNWGLNRRRFLALAAGAGVAGTLWTLADSMGRWGDGGYSVSGGPDKIPPTPTMMPGLVPEAIADERWEMLDIKTRFNHLRKGVMPKSWDSYDLHDREQRDLYIDAIGKEIRRTVIPAIAQATGQDADRADNVFYIARDKKEMEDILVNDGGADRESAQKLAIEDIGLNYALFDRQKEAFGERIVAVNIGDEAEMAVNSGDYLRSKFPGNEIFGGNHYINSNATFFTVDTAIHELIHYFTENIHRVSEDDNRELMGLYVGRFDRLGEQRGFIYSTGAKLYVVRKGDTEDPLGSYNDDLMEPYRSYHQWYAVNKVAGKSHQTTPEVWDMSPSDAAQYFIVEKIHNDLGITPERFLEVYGEGTYMDILRFYRDSAASKGYSFSLADVADMMRLISGSSSEIVALLRVTQGTEMDSVIVRKITEDFDEWDEFLKSKRDKRSGRAVPSFRVIFAG